MIILFVEAVKVWNGGICTIQREFQPCLPPSCPSTYQKQLETFEQEMNADRNHSSNLLHNGCGPAVCHIIPVQ